MKIFTLFCIAFLVPVCSFSQQDYREFGDAPEGAIAYPSTGIIGLFPTCMTVGPNGFVIHNNFGAFFVGFDLEVDGNAGLCPMFAPYDNDECFGDGSAVSLLARICAWLRILGGTLGEKVVVDQLTRGFGDCRNNPVRIGIMPIHAPILVTHDRINLVLVNNPKFPVHGFLCRMLEAIPKVGCVILAS